MKTPRLSDFDPDAKVPTLKSSLDSMPAIVKPQSVITPHPEAEKQPLTPPNKLAIQPPVGKTTNAQQVKSEKFDKYSTYLRPGYKKELKTIALERDCKDYEVLDEAITLYIKSLKDK